MIANSRGQLGNLTGIFLTLTVVAALVAASFFLLGNFHGQTEVIAGENASSVTALNNTLNAFGIIPDLLPIMVVIVMIVVILTVLLLLPGRSGGA